MKLAKIGSIFLVIVLTASNMGIFAQAALEGTAVFVFKPAREASGSRARESGGSGARGGGGGAARTGTGNRPADTNRPRTGSQTPSPPVTTRGEPIAPADWLNTDADLAIEERKISDSEPFLSLSNGFLNSRYTFCESPQFPDAARRARQKLVNSEMLVTVAKYGGLLNAKEIKGDASFRAAVYKILGSMQFKQSYFMGQPIRIEGVLSFSQNPANSLICRDATRDVEIPPFIEGGDLTGKATVCEAPAFPADAKAAGLKTVEAKVDVTVGEDGKVLDAKLSGGHQAFGASAVQTALKMAFPKSSITNKPAKVRGTIIFSQTPDNSAQCKKV